MRSYDFNASLLGLVSTWAELLQTAHTRSFQQDTVHFFALINGFTDCADMQRSMQFFPADDRLDFLKFDKQAPVAKQAQRMGRLLSPHMNDVHEQVAVCASEMGLRVTDQSVHAQVNAYHERTLRLLANFHQLGHVDIERNDLHVNVRIEESRALRIISSALARGYHVVYMTPHATPLAGRVAQHIQGHVVQAGLTTLNISPDYLQRLTREKPRMLDVACLMHSALVLAEDLDRALKIIQQHFTDQPLLVVIDSLPVAALNGSRHLPLLVEESDLLNTQLTILPNPYLRSVDYGLATNLRPALFYPQWRGDEGLD